jgi:hypothetical protein
MNLKLNELRIGIDNFVARIDGLKEIRTAALNDCTTRYQGEYRV